MQNEELLSLVKENNILLKTILTYLTNPEKDYKDFLMNVVANQFGR